MAVVPVDRSMVSDGNSVEKLVAIIAFYTFSSSNKVSSPPR